MSFSNVAAPFGKVSKVVAGGNERADSVLAGVEAHGGPRRNSLRCTTGRVR